MKVYYNIGGDQLSEEFKEIPDKAKKLILEKWKYKTMWELRSLEKEINEEGGIIIVSLNGVKTRHFSPELTSRIESLIKP